MTKWIELISEHVINNMTAIAWLWAYMVAIGIWLSILTFIIAKKALK